MPRSSLVCEYTIKLLYVWYCWWATLNSSASLSTCCETSTLIWDQVFAALTRLLCPQYRRSDKILSLTTMPINYHVTDTHWYDCSQRNIRTVPLLPRTYHLSSDSTPLQIDMFAQLSKHCHDPQGHHHTTLKSSHTRFLWLMHDLMLVPEGLVSSQPWFRWAFPPVLSRTWGYRRALFLMHAEFGWGMHEKRTRACM